MGPRGKVRTVRDQSDRIALGYRLYVLSTPALLTHGEGANRGLMKLSDQACFFASTGPSAETGQESGLLGRRSCPTVVLQARPPVRRRCRARESARACRREAKAGPRGDKGRAERRSQSGG